MENTIKRDYKMRHTLLLGCILASSSTLADIQLPNPLSTDLDSTQVNENIEYLRNEANSALAAIEALQAITTTPVLERMAAGTELTLATQGDLSVKASCSFNNGSESSQGYSLELWTETTSAGSLVYSENDSGYYGEFENTTSVWVNISTSNDTDTEWGNEIDQGVTVSPQGHVIMMDGETFGYGISVQGSDCLISGQISSFKGDAAPEDFDASLLNQVPDEV